MSNRGRGDAIWPIPASETDGFSPCPRCQTTDNIRVEDMTGDDPWFVVIHHVPGCGLNMGGPTREKAIENWSTRPASLLPLYERFFEAWPAYNPDAKFRRAIDISKMDSIAEEIRKARV